MTDRDQPLGLTDDDLAAALAQVREGPAPDADELFVAGVRYGAEHLHRLLVEIADDVPASDTGTDTDT